MTEPNVSRLMRTRKAHRGCATKSMTRANDELFSTLGIDHHRLKQIQNSLKERLKTLSTLNEQIQCLIEEDDQEEEIDQSDVINDNIDYCLIGIEEELRRASTARTTTATAPATAPSDITIPTPVSDDAGTRSAPPTATRSEHTRTDPPTTDPPTTDAAEVPAPLDPTARPWVPAVKLPKLT